MSHPVLNLGTPSTNHLTTCEDNWPFSLTAGILDVYVPLKCGRGSKEEVLVFTSFFSSLYRTLIEGTLYFISKDYLVKSIIIISSHLSVSLPNILIVFSIYFLSLLFLSLLQFNLSNFISSQSPRVDPTNSRFIFDEKFFSLIFFFRHWKIIFPFPESLRKGLLREFQHRKRNKLSLLTLSYSPKKTFVLLVNRGMLNWGIVFR